MQRKWMVALVSAMLVTGCVEGKEAERDQSSVKEQFEQLEAINEDRKAVLDGLEDEALVRLLWQEQHSNYFDMLNLVPFHMVPDQFSTLSHGCCDWRTIQTSLI